MSDEGGTEVAESPAENPEPAPVSESVVTIAVDAHVPWPAGRPRPRRRPRRRVSNDLRPAGISGWGWTLFCLALTIIAYRLPFFDPGGSAGEAWRYALPGAVNGGDVENAPIIMFEHGRVLIDGRLQVTDEAILANRPGAFDELVETLTILHRNWAILHPRDPFPGVILISAPQGTDWAVMHPVLLAAASAGYPSVSFLVLSNANGPPFAWTRFEEP